MSATTSKGLAIVEMAPPEAVTTISSLSPLRRFKTWITAINRAIGAITASRFGIASDVIERSVTTSWPFDVTSLSCLRAKAIQTTPISDSRDQDQGAACLSQEVVREGRHEPSSPDIACRQPSPNGKSD